MVTVIFIILVAAAAFYVSSRISTDQAITPTSPAGSFAAGGCNKNSVKSCINKSVGDSCGADKECYVISGGKCGCEDDINAATSAPPPPTNNGGNDKIIRCLKDDPDSCFANVSYKCDNEHWVKGGSACANSSQPLTHSQIVAKCIKKNQAECQLDSDCRWSSSIVTASSTCEAKN